MPTNPLPSKLGSSAAPTPSTTCHGFSLRHLALLTLVPALLLPLAAATDVPLDVNVDFPSDDPRPVDVQPDEPGRMIGMEYLQGLKDHLGDEQYLQATVLAQLEQQGSLGPGTAAGGAAGGSPPTQYRRDTHLICDVNGDGAQDMVVQDNRGATMLLFLRDGATGDYGWAWSNEIYLTPAQMSAGLYPDRAGLSTPRPRPNLAPTVDLDGDGVCDILTLSIRFGTYIPLLIGFHQQWNTYITARSGDTGQVIWRRPFEGSFTYSAVNTDFAREITIQITGLPTGFTYFNASSGPKYAVKLSDLTFNYYEERQVTGLYFFDERLNDHIYYTEATRPGTVDKWRRDLLFNEDAGVSNFTWITGAVQLGGGDEDPELVLDQYYILTPRGNAQMNDPTTGKPLYRWGRGMSVLSLDGQNGFDQWRTLVMEQQPLHVRLDSEEQYQVLIWTHAKIVGDLDADGVPEVAALWLAREAGEDGTPNGAMRTHLRPLSGADGHHFWNTDPLQGDPHQYRGWGFVSDLNPDASTSVPLIAIGTVDLPLGDLDLPPGGRFPPKLFMLRVVDARDGAVQWYHEEPFSNDNYLPYQLALSQFERVLAPYDWNQDGVRDVVSPSRYIAPAGTEQGLLSTSKHSYLVLSGTEGPNDLLSTLEAWGTTGVVVPCVGANGELTVVSGHARRLDLTRFDVGSGEPVWRTVLYDDPRIQAATAGADLVLLGTTCQETEAPDNRTMAAVNLFRTSPHRGFEVVPINSFLYLNGSRQWINPLVDPDPGLMTFLDLLPEPGVPATATENAVVNIGPAILGMSTGLSIGILRNRNRPKGGGPQ